MAWRLCGFLVSWNNDYEQTSLNLNKMEKTQNFTHPRRGNDLGLKRAIILNSILFRFDWHDLIIYKPVSICTYFSNPENYWKHVIQWTDCKYHQTSSISRTKYKIWNVSRCVLQLSFSNLLKPGVKSRIKMQLEHCRQVMPWWRHQMETFSALLAICAGNSPVPGEFPAQRPVTRSFDVFFDLRLNKWLSKQSWGWWFKTISRSL